jgi:hypothetical protein
MNSKIEMMCIVKCFQIEVYNTPDKWEVGLDCAYFTPKEIEVGTKKNKISLFMLIA